MIFNYRENKTHYLRIELFDWNEGGASVEIPELFPLFLLHSLARRPGQRDLLSVQSEFVEVLQSPAQDKEPRGLEISTIEEYRD